MHVRLLLPLVLLAAFLTTAAPAPAAKQKRKVPKTVYLSLGDSLAWGYARADDGSVVQSEKDFSGRLEARARRSRGYSSKLRVRRFGCPGETAVTYRFGGRCKYIGFASQNKAARAFLRHNRRHVAFVTISLGTNVFAPCAFGAFIDFDCLERGRDELGEHMGDILRGLRDAAGRRIPIVVGNQYDPFLALYLQGPEHRRAAIRTVKYFRQANQRIFRAARHKRARARVADVFGPFRTGELEKTTSVAGQPAPAAVGAVCRLTLMCRSEPMGPDVHPNEFGYNRIATAFAEALRLR